jgi:hypothetical protein
MSFEIDGVTYCIYPLLDDKPNFENVLVENRKCFAKKKFKKGELVENGLINADGTTTGYILFYNISENPNVKLICHFVNKTVCVVAIKNIEIGDELTKSTWSFS